MSEVLDFSKVTSKRANLEEESQKTDLELMEDFNQTEVEPINFVRNTLLGHEECLSYL